MRFILPAATLVAIVILCSLPQSEGVSRLLKRREGGGDDEALKAAVLDFATKVSKSEVSVDYKLIKSGIDSVTKFLETSKDNKAKIFNFFKSKIPFSDVAKAPTAKLDDFWKVIKTITEKGLPSNIKIVGGKATEEGEAGCRKLKVLLAMYKKYTRDTRWVEKNLKKLEAADKELAKAGASVADSLLTAIPFYSSVRDVAQSVSKVYDVAKDGGALAFLIENLLKDNFFRDLESNFTIISQLKCENA